MVRVGNSFKECKFLYDNPTYSTSDQMNSELAVALSKDLLDLSYWLLPVLSYAYVPEALRLKSHIISYKVTIIVNIQFLICGAVINALDCI